MAEPMDNLTFEQALERLDSVVRDLESTETGLDKSLERYEDGVRLLQRCRAILDEAERKIRLLTGVDAEGNPVTTDFDATSTAERDAANNCGPAENSKRTTARGPRRAASERTAEKEQLF